MSDEVHKLIMPPQPNGYMSELILCGSEKEPETVNVILINPQYSTNINDVDCPNCWELWRKGFHENVRKAKEC